MCERNYSYKSNDSYKIEVIAPCGEVVMVQSPGAMRDIDLINGNALITSARLFFRELGFIGENWKVRVTKTSMIAGYQCSLKTIITEKVFC